MKFGVDTRRKNEKMQMPSRMSDNTKSNSTLGILKLKILDCNSLDLSLKFSFRLLDRSRLDIAPCRLQYKFYSNLGSYFGQYEKCVGFWRRAFDGTNVPLTAQTQTNNTACYLVLHAFSQFAFQLVRHSRSAFPSTLLHK